MSETAPEAIDAVTGGSVPYGREQTCMVAGQPK